VDYSAAVASPALGAILWLGYPGQSGGAALASILTGATSPAGRLVTTIYPASYVRQVSMLDMRFRPSTTSQATDAAAAKAAASSPGRTYRFYPPQLAVFEFGFGLSYTSFQFEWLREAEGDESASVTDSFSSDDSSILQSLSIRHLHAAHQSDRRSAAVQFRVSVTNAGSITSDCVVLLFLSYDQTSTADSSEPTPPLKQLIGFDRIVALQPGDTRQVDFGVQARQFASVNSRGEHWLRPGRFRLGLDVPTSQWRQVELTGLAMQLLD